MLELFQRGGIMMYPLALSSLIALAFIIERAFALRRKKILVPEIVSVVQNFNTLEDLGLAKTVCLKHQGPLANVLRISLENHEMPHSELREILEDIGRQEVRVLEKGLIVLETIAAIAPLMGLLGTVLGMIHVFAVIKEQGIGQTAALSGGISEALLTTVAGLFIAIPVLIAYYYFNQKSESLILDIENYTNTLITKITTLKRNQNVGS
ncbi:MAG TPA: MotA/TolQ/ExbB proton channel family protein [Caldithrix abyssi]|uniref:MotA/TolQ/ExbB proton channel family protein n=1 Tax=Caldithrix abyssi TaxID=187145 RepID=A0A7V5PR07_CALAY|nr:MotA/TolQ/ExbB proton channel family protein [Caldithrix abyssi]